MASEIYKSPLGNLLIEASKKGIRAVTRKKDNAELLDELSIENPHIKVLRGELDMYFKGELKSFKVELDFEGYTVFQQAVWAKLLEIPYGKTISYKSLAISLGDVKKIRAVGGANGRNPIPIVVPCHRVIGSDGSLVGYSGGLDMKTFLLELEGVPHQLKLF